jgi:hypothetical protein
MKPPPTTVTDRNAELFDESSRERDWLNPIAMSSIQRAVKRKHENVILNGIPFSIEYGVMWKSKLIPDYECICLRRVDGGSVPFGYISIKRIQEFKFEGDDK